MRSEIRRGVTLLQTTRSVIVNNKYRKNKNVRVIWEPSAKTLYQ